MSLCLDSCQDLRFPQGLKDFRNQQLIPQLTMQALLAFGGGRYNVGALYYDSPSNLSVVEASNGNIVVEFLEAILSSKTT